MNEDAKTGSVEVTRSMINSIRSTKPWTKFLAILGFVSVGFMVLLGAGFILFSNMFPHQKTAPQAFIGFLYILFSVLYFMPAFYLYKYSSSIAHFLESNGAADLEAALSYQKSVWKFAGIVALIGLVLGILGIAAAVAVPILIKAPFTV